MSDMETITARIAVAIRKPFKSLLKRIPLEIRWRRPRPHWPGDEFRFEFQSRYVQFDIRPGDRILDIGSGGDPFPHATVLSERYLSPTRHRCTPLKRDGRPLVLSDVEALPFRSKSFDYVYCAHVLEHVENPARACAEILRVGRRGFIETPTRCKDLLFAWARDMHRWHLVGIGRNLCFFEYTERELDGIKSRVWEEMVFSRWRNPIQEAFYENQDIFNVLFCWDSTFDIHVFRKDGSVETLRA